MQDQKDVITAVQKNLGDKGEWLMKSLYSDYTGM